VCTSDGFDPNGHKLIKNSSYNFKKPPPLGNIIEARPYRLNDIEKMIQRQGGSVEILRIRLGYIPSQLVKNSR